MKTGPHELSQDIATDDAYEAMPYPSMPYAHTQPARLAAVASLYGLNSPNPETARVLELGCASGGNIIPLAARYPRAHFVGVDLVHRHVEDARTRIAALSLHNIDVRQADLADVSFHADAFDYVICHGVFSWAPRRPRTASFEFAATCFRREVSPP